MTTYNGYTNHATWDFMNYYGDQLRLDTEGHAEEYNKEDLRNLMYQITCDIIDELKDESYNSLDNLYLNGLLDSKIESIDVDDIADTLAGDLYD